MPDEQTISVLGKSYSYNIDRSRYALLIPAFIFVIIHLGHKIVGRDYHAKSIFGYIDGPPALLYMIFLIVLLSTLTIAGFRFLLAHWKQDRRIVLDEECLYVIHGHDFDNAEDFIPYTTMRRLSILDSSSSDWKKIITFRIDCIDGNHDFYRDSFSSIEEFDDFTSEITERSNLKRLYISPLANFS